MKNTENVREVEVKEIKDKLHKAIEELDTKDLGTLETVSAGAVDVVICSGGCFKQK